MSNQHYTQIINEFGRGPEDFETEQEFEEYCKEVKNQEVKEYSE